MPLLEVFFVVSETVLAPFISLCFPATLKGWRINKMGLKNERMPLQIRAKAISIRQKNSRLIDHKFLFYMCDPTYSTKEKW